jgi:hypothetical protein
MLLLLGCGSEMLGVSLSAKRSHWRGAEGTLDFRTSHILTAFAKSVSPHSYKGRFPELFARKPLFLTFCIWPLTNCKIGKPFERKNPFSDGCR